MLEEPKSVLDFRIPADVEETFKKMLGKAVVPGKLRDVYHRVSFMAARANGGSVHFSPGELAIIAAISGEDPRPKPKPEKKGKSVNG